MKLLEQLLYTKNHEWVKVEEDKAYIGITDYAQEHLGDVVFVELPTIDSEFNVDDSFAVIESVKAASDIYIPISGKILEVNEDLVENPEKINEDPYENWMILIELKDKSQINNLLSAKEYEELCVKEG